MGAMPVQIDSVAINASTLENFTMTIPSMALATSSVNITLQHVDNGYVIGQTFLTVDVQSVSGWRLNLTQADLEVDPAGENLTFELIHTGNAYERPYFAKAGAGWNITLPDDAEDVAPYGTSTFQVHVQPPTRWVAGEVGVLRIRQQETTRAVWSLKKSRFVGASPHPR